VAAVLGLYGRPISSVPAYKTAYLSYASGKYSASGFSNPDAGIYVFGSLEPTLAHIRDGGGIDPLDVCAGYRSEDYQALLSADNGKGGYCLPPGGLSELMSKMLTRRKVPYPSNFAGVDRVMAQSTNSFTRTFPIMVDGEWRVATSAKGQTPLPITDVTGAEALPSAIPVLAPASKLLDDATENVRDANDTIAIATVGMLPVAGPIAPAPVTRAAVQYAPLVPDAGLTEAIASAPDPAQQEDIIAVIRVMLGAAVVRGPQGPSGPGFAYLDNVRDWHPIARPRVAFPREGDAGGGRPFCREYGGFRLTFSHAGDGLRGSQTLPYKHPAGTSAYVHTDAAHVSEIVRLQAQLASARRSVVEQLAAFEAVQAGPAGRAPSVEMAKNLLRALATSMRSAIERDSTLEGIDLERARKVAFPKDPTLEGRAERIATLQQRHISLPVIVLTGDGEFVEDFVKDVAQAVGRTTSKKAADSELVSECRRVAEYLRGATRMLRDLGNTVGVSFASEGDGARTLGVALRDLFDDDPAITRSMIAYVFPGSGPSLWRGYCERGLERGDHQATDQDVDNAIEDIYTTDCVVLPTDLAPETRMLMFAWAASRYRTLSPTDRNWFTDKLM